MTNLSPELSSTLTSDESSKKLTSWNVTVEGNAALEEAFLAETEEKIRKRFPGTSRNDEITREMVRSTVLDVRSVEDLRDSQIGWASEIFEEAVAERLARTSDFTDRRAALVAELTEDTDDSFELYGLERNLPADAPRKVTDTLGLIAATKANLTNIDDFVRINEGEAFQRVGILAFTTGVFAEGGIAIESDQRGHRLIFPTTPGSLHSARYDNITEEMQIFAHKEKNLQANITDFDDGIAVQPVEHLLRADTLWSSMTSYNSVFSTGQFPQGPFFSEPGKAAVEYESGFFDFYHKHVDALRVLTRLATDSESRSNIESL